MKLTENEVIEILCHYLEKEGWSIENKAINHDRGEDIVAKKDNKLLIVEAKGAKGNPKSSVTKKVKFDSGQIKTHFGKAIVKILDEKLKPKYKNSTFAIAHPDDADIRKTIGKITPFLKQLDIIHFWVSADGQVIEEN